jgi:SCP-2 sterol transfer family protein
VSEFLSPEWIAELEEAALAAPAVDALTGSSLAVQQIVHADDREVRYHFALDHGRLRIGPGTVPDPDIILTTDRETAWALHRGALNAQEALAGGRLKLSGRVERLTRAKLQMLGDVFAELRARTTYDA